MRHPEIREVLVKRIMAARRSPSRALVVEELGLSRGKSRIDLALISSHLHGFEIKSGYDTLERLPSQWRIYSQIFAKVEFVMATKHVERATRLLPEWVGLLEIDDVKKRLIRRRKPYMNPDQNPEAIANLLWRDEALMLLENLGLDKGLRSKPRPQLCSALAREASAPLLQKLVSECLCSREQWRINSNNTDKTIYYLN